MSNGPGNSGSQVVSFSLADAQRISAVVAEAEGSRRGRKGSTLPRAAGGGGGSVVLATFTGAWSKNQTKVVSLLSDPTSTAAAMNVVANVSPHTGNIARVCCLAMAQTAASGAATYVAISIDRC
jgi:hypothetical protein